MRAAIWAGTVAAAILAGLVLQRLAVPGGLLVGPLIVGIAIATSGRVTPPKIPRIAFTGAQATIGCLVATAFAPAMIVTLGHDLLTLLLVVGSTVVAAGIVGWTLARTKVLDASTAAWGSSPGGASAMVAMSMDEGADARLVAFQQYLRVTVVVLTAAGVARVLGVHAAVTPAAAAAAARPLDLVAFAATVAVAVAGTFIAVRLRVPAGALLGPMVIGSILEATGLLRLVVPPIVLVAAYVAIGLSIGLLYTRETLLYALRALPALLGATLLLTILCCGSAALLVATLHVDALTAYLATTPGGLDSVTVIALGSGSDISLVLALQALRLLVVLLTGPAVARFIQRVA